MAVLGDFPSISDCGIPYSSFLLFCCPQGPQNLQLDHLLHLTSQQAERETGWERQKECLRIFWSQTFKYITFPTCLWQSGSSGRPACQQSRRYHFPVCLGRKWHGMAGIERCLRHTASQLPGHNRPPTAQWPRDASPWTLWLVIFVTLFYAHI